jgi:hypothetical protein
MTMRAPRIITAVAGAAGLLLASLLNAPSALATHVATNQKIAIPAYWGPDTTTGATMFDRLAQNVPTNDIVVINGSQSKPQTPFNSAWADAIAKVHGSGELALAYVDTGYYGFTFPPASPHYTRADGPGAGSNSTTAWTAQIEQDIDDWYTLYGSSGIDGIFLDEATEPCGTASNPSQYVDLYAAISDYISLHHPDAYVIINPGVPVDQCYESVADTIITFEGSYSDYVNHTYPTKTWQLNSTNPAKFWHLIYDVPNATAMQAVIAQSKQENAGYVYVTDDTLTIDGSGTVTNFPWDTLPPYWDSELVAASGSTDTTAPDAPDGLAATSIAGTTSAQVDLTWNNPYDNVATSHYEVFRDGTSIGTVYDNALDVTGLSLNTAYSFTVKAVDAAGNVSALSSPLNVTTPGAASASILNPTACYTTSTAQYGADYVDPVAYHRVFIDADDNGATGYNLGTSYLTGADYMIENGFLYSYAGPGWAWNQVSGVAPLVSAAHGVYYRWQVPTSALTAAGATQKLLFQASSPDAYSSVLTVNPTASC